LLLLLWLLRWAENRGEIVEMTIVVIGKGGQSVVPPCDRETTSLSFPQLPRCYFGMNVIDNNVLRLLLTECD
jgi:hypothetical protein